MSELDDFRKAFDRIVFTLIDRADADPGLGERADILALLLRSRRDDGRCQVSSASPVPGSAPGSAAVIWTVLPW